MIIREIVTHDKPYNTAHTYKEVTSDLLTQCITPNIRNAQHIERSDWWTMSPINEKDKYTRNMRNCQSIIIVWEEKDEDEIISSMSHQAPDAIGYLDNHNYVLNQEGKKLEATLLEYLQSFKQQTTSTHIYLAGWSIVDQEQEELYTASKKFREIFFTTQGYTIQSFDPSITNTSRWLYLSHENKKLLEIWSIE